MPPLPPAPSCLRVALMGDIDNTDVWLTRFFIQFTGTAPTSADLSTFVSAVDTQYSTHLAALADVDTHMTAIEATDLTSSTGATALGAFSVTGSRTGTPMANQVCTVSSYKIARRYRGGHPRGYWRFGTSTDMLDTGHWGSAFVSAVNSGLGSFFTGVLAAGWTGAGTLSHVSLSYFSGFTVVVNPITGRAKNVPTLRSSPTIDPVTTIQTRASIGTQRRREAFVD